MNTEQSLAIRVAEERCSERVKQQDESPSAHISPAVSERYDRTVYDYDTREAVRNVSAITSG